MLQRKHSSSREPKKTVKVRLMCQGRKDEVWSVASSVEVCGLKESYKQKNKIQLTQDMMWMFNGREIRDDERMFEIGMKYRRENIIMIMKRNTDRPSNERDCHTFNRAPIDQVTILDDEEHEAPLDNYRDFNTDLTEDEYFNSSETDEDYNDRQERFEKMKKVKEASEKRKDRQTSSVKLAEQVENYKGNLEIGEILKNIGEHNVETKHKPKKGKVKKKKSNSRKILKESPPENLEEEAMVERKQNDKKVDLNDGEVLIEQSIESTDDNLDLSSWEKVSKGSRKKPKKTGMEKKPEKGKREKYIVKSLEDSWPPLDSNPSYKRTILSSRNNAASTETCPISEKNDFLFDYVDQNKKSLDESDCNANIKESKEVADCNANIKVAEEEVFSIKSEVGNQLDKTNETAKESNTAQSSISVNYQQEQNVNLGSNDDISQANDSHVIKSPLMTSKIEPSRQPLPKVTNDLKSNNVLQELSPTPKTTEHKILKGNVPEVKESIDCFPKIEKDFFCPIKTCPLVSDVVPFGPQTKTINNFQTIPSSASNIKSPFGFENVSFSNAGQTENYEYGSSTDSVKLCAVVSREVTANADLTASSQVLMEDRDKVTRLREVELDAIQPNCTQEGEETCTPSSSGSPEDSDELATLHPNRINEGEQMYTSSHDASEEHLQCRASYGTRGQEDSELVQARDAHERQSVTSQPEFPLESMCPLPGLAVSQQNYLLPPVLQAENLPYDGPSKPPITALSISSISFGLDSAETPPVNISSDDKKYPKNLKDLHIVEEGNFSSKLSDDPFVKPPEQLLSPIHDGQPEPGQEIVFLQPLVFFCAQVPQLPYVPQVNVAAFSGTSQQPHAFSGPSQQSHAFFGATQQPDAFSGTSQQPNAFFGASQQHYAFFGASQQPYAFSSTSQQPQLYLPNRFSESTQAPVMLYLPPEQSSVGSPQLQTHLTAQRLPQQYQLVRTGQHHPSRAQQHSEQFPCGVQQEKQLLSGLPQPQQQFLNVQYPQIPNVTVQQLLPSQQQPQLSSAQQHLPSILQQKLPFVQQQLSSVNQQHLPSVQQQQQLLPALEQQRPYVHQQLFPYAQQQFSSINLPQHQQLASVNLYEQQQHTVDPQLQQFPSLQQQLQTVNPQLQQFPSLQQQQHAVDLQLQQFPSLQQQQHAVNLQLQQFPSVQQQQQTVDPQLQQFPSLQQQQHTVNPQLQQFPSVQQQQLFGVNLPESHHCPPAEHSAHQHVTSQHLPVEHSQQLSLNLPYQQISGVNQSDEPQDNSAP